MAISYRYRLNGGSWVSVSSVQSCSNRPNLYNVHTSLEIDSLNIPAGEEFTFWQFPDPDYLGTPVGWSIQGPQVNAALPQIALKRGTVSDVTKYGICLDCQPIQATHYQIRWEFDRIVTLDSDGNSGNYHLSPIFPIPPGGVDDVVHRFAGFLAPYVASRIRFCDSGGSIRPYRGSGYIGHSLNPDGSGWMGSPSSFFATGSDVLYTAVTPLVQSLADGVGTTSVNTLVSFSASDEILDGDCETIEPPGDDDDDLVELPEGEDPPDGEDPPEKKDGEKGKRKDDPDSVETCECYDIINQRLTDINNNIAILNDNMLDQMQVHNDTFAILITKMQEWTRYLSAQWRVIMLEKNKFDDLRQKRFEQFLTSGSGEKIADSVQRATDALYVSDSDSAHDGDSIADLHNSVFHSTLNEDMSITDVIENIEPVHIENEYRTQSHRVIDNLDEVVNKL